jgi:hypothetical protein
VREIGLCRGLLSLLCCLSAVPADFLGLGAGLWGTAGAVVVLRAGGCRDVLGAESALLLDAVV